MWRGSSGASGLSIIARDIIPYMLSYLAMAFTLQLSSAVLTEASLSMLGLGPTNTVSLGVLLQWALLWEAVRLGNWWTFLPPAFPARAHRLQPPAPQREPG